MHGRIEEKTGAVKEAAHYEVKAEAELGRALDALGMSPMARSRLGLNLAQSFDLAQMWAAQHEHDRCSEPDVEGHAEEEPDG